MYAVSETTMRSPNSSERPSIAPVWHTWCLLAILALFSALSAYLRMGSATPRVRHVLLFSIIIAFEWLTFAFSIWNSSPVFVSFVARVGRNPRSLPVDILVALLLSAICFAVAPVVMRLLGPTGWPSLEGMRPHGGWEIAAWILMALSAGICEETVYRGYLQQQFSGLTGCTGLGVFAQEAAFALAHEYQGWKNMVLIFILGCILGAVAAWRKGLRANIVAHAVADILAAF